MKDESQGKMELFKKIWYRYWRKRLHWCNGKGNPLVTYDLKGAYLHFVCSLCGQAVKQDGQRNWIYKKLGRMELYYATEFRSKSFNS